MKLMIYPGSFDPVTLGHYDIICRASKMTDHLVVAVMNNSTKTHFFSVEERMEMLRQVTAHLPNVELDWSDELMVKYTSRKKADAVIRGLRAVTDFEYELQWATLNQKLDPDFEALFMMACSDYSFLSSGMVREIGKLGGDISAMVPPEIHDYVKDRLMKSKK